jgi:hypothetical protein
LTRIEIFYDKASGTTQAAAEAVVVNGLPLAIDSSCGRQRLWFFSQMPIRD